MCGAKQWTAGGCAIRGDCRLQLHTVREQVAVGPGHAIAARGPQPQQAPPRQRRPQPPIDVLQQRRSMLTTD